jgi:hypothetical protein
MHSSKMPRLPIERLRSLTEGVPMPATPGKDDAPPSAIEIARGKWRTFRDEDKAGGKTAAARPQRSVFLETRRA